MNTIIHLNNTHPGVKHLCNVDSKLASVINRIGEISYTPHDDGYAFLIHEIIEQMLSVKAASKIYGRLVDLCDGCIMPAIISNLSDQQIREIGTSNSKVQYIRNITDAIINGELNLNELTEMNDNAVIKELTKVKGIGVWTANMYLIFVLDRNDILPTNDTAFLQAYRWLYSTEDILKKSIETRCSVWKPYSSIAARFLYRALDTGLTKEPL